ncbi:MAG: hypothetical protein KC432_14935, partial [Thermomicrobiales bacterium]|nr:hypothetical protein [Thermomicrobiales bacterium]
ERQAVSRISPETLASWLEGDDPPIVLDVRSRAAAGQGGGIPGSIRVPLDDIETWARDRPRERPIVTYCTCPEDASAVRAAELLQAEGFAVSALRGGLAAWQARDADGVGEEVAA